MNVNKVNPSVKTYTQDVKAQEAKAKEAASQATKQAEAGAQTKGAESVVTNMVSSAKATSVSQNARLEKLAEQIKNKTFKVDPEAIANKMLEDKDTIASLLNS